MHVKINDLPPSVQAALESVGYGRADIRVETDETFCPRPPSGDGCRGFTAACRLDGSTAHEIRWGSWGGSNIFSRTIDDAGDSVAIPPGVAILSGCTGGGKPVYASLTVRPDGLDPRVLAAPVVTPREAFLLAIFARLKSSARPEYLGRARAQTAEIDALVSRGYLSRNKIGAITVTTAGKSAAGRDYDLWDRTDPRLVPEGGTVEPDPVTWR